MHFVCLMTAVLILSGDWEARSNRHMRSILAKWRRCGKCNQLSRDGSQTLKLCLILSLHSAGVMAPLCWGSAWVCITCRNEQQGRRGVQVGQEAAALPELWVLSTAFGTPTSRVRRCTSPDSGASVRPSISLRSKFHKSQNHGHLNAKAIPRKPSLHINIPL